MAEDIPGFDAWDAEEAFIHSWLLSTMTSDMYANFLYMDTVELWDQVHSSCSEKNNDWRTYALIDKVQKMTQGNHSNMEYSCEFKAV